MGTYFTTEPKPTTDQERWSGITRRIVAWRERNFPHTDAGEQLLGVCEELGELCHAELKGRQGIRLTPEEVQAKKRDALGDICVYLASHCSLLMPPGKELRWEYEAPSTTPPEQTFPALMKAQEALGDLCATYLLLLDTAEEDGQPNQEMLHNYGMLVGYFLERLEEYAVLLGWRLTDLLSETWDAVEFRDWVQHPLDAAVVAEAKQRLTPEEFAAEYGCTPAPEPAVPARRRKPSQVDRKKA